MWEVIILISLHQCTIIYLKSSIIYIYVCFLKLLLVRTKEPGEKAQGCYLSTNLDAEAGVRDSRWWRDTKASGEKRRKKMRIQDSMTTVEMPRAAWTGL